MISQCRDCLSYAQADDVPCTMPYDSDGTADAVCEGPARKNGFYGECIVDALDAVTKK